MALKFDYFNTWFARIYKPLDYCVSGEKHLVDELILGLSNSLESLQQILSSVLSEGGVEYVHGKGHIALPTFVCDVSDGVLSVDKVSCKIRINPCFLHEDDNSHTKIWIIFYNENLNPVDLDNNTYVLLVKYFRKISLRIYDCVERAVSDVIGGLSLEKMDSDVSFINTSLHPDAPSPRGDFFDVANSSDLSRCEATDEVAKEYLLTLRRLSDPSCMFDSEDIVLKSTLKLAKGLSYKAYQRVSSAKNHMLISGIYSIGATEYDRKACLYREPRLRAIDFCIHG